MRLDRLLSGQPSWNRRHAQLLLIQGRVRVNNEVIRQGEYEVSQFASVDVDDQSVQHGKAALYLMLNKPAGVVSATTDPEHPTALSLLPQSLQTELHIAGRLDKASTGLLLLTNDGLWSRRITEPELKKPKTYLVTLANPIDPGTAERFAQGIYFEYEGITTSPAQLQQLDSHRARLTIFEGRYHQIKRMFGRFRNPVVGLHRETMGPITLDPLLKAGEYRYLTKAEITAI
ncbi:pseudouridine synthase [Ferrimonas lipolytica]|uniref:Pseudouridine synthase n=1 Tax=Ferrimonas lipolytica TaxID=2724191 RepID=A0A6H1UEE6_9GAMM|nr:pseudouridine synthase [Ferrimonas lipolytica]QIZ77465.1 pseudouridine synthase [Ferrimonas lipolytica]